MTALKKLDPWLPPLALMGMIFFFSAQPNLSSGLGWIDHVRTRVDRTKALAAAWAIAALYAATDEYHQSFVSGRHATWVDVAIDSMGAGVFALLVVRARRDRVAA
jgi:VanZ family protein